MSSKRHTPEQIINKLRQAEVEIANGATISQAAKKIGVTDQTYYRWRNEYVRPQHISYTASLRAKVHLDADWVGRRWGCTLGPRGPRPGHVPDHAQGAKPRP
jgi:DNA-binding XRE family transcriptional regulator